MDFDNQKVYGDTSITDGFVETAINLCWWFKSFWSLISPFLVLFSPFWFIISPFWSIISSFLAFSQCSDSTPLWLGRGLSLCRNSRRCFLVYFLPHRLQSHPLAQARSWSDKTLGEQQWKRKPRRRRGTEVWGLLSFSLLHTALGFFKNFSLVIDRPAIAFCWWNTLQCLRP